MVAETAACLHLFFATTENNKGLQACRQHFSKAKEYYEMTSHYKKIKLK
jgi:hypothetical protein